MDDNQYITNCIILELEQLKKCIIELERKIEALNMQQNKNE